MNMTFAKNIAMGGARKLQVRADFFSLLNKKNWGNPVTAINASDFGRLTSAVGNRTMQLGARLSF
jgi:hypothetical protein